MWSRMSSSDLPNRSAVSRFRRRSIDRSRLMRLSYGGDLRCVTCVVSGLKCGVTKHCSYPGEISIAEVGFQTFEARAELAVDRVRGAVQRRGGPRVSGAAGYQCQTEVRVGDHQLITVAVRNRQRLIEHRPGIGVGVVE